MPVCPKCQAAFPDGTGTCQFDGTTLVAGAVCPTCSLEHTPGSTQCRICGGRLERALISRPGGEGARGQSAPMPGPAPTAGAAGPPRAGGVSPRVPPVAGGYGPARALTPLAPPDSAQESFAPTGSQGAWPVPSGPAQPPGLGVAAPAASAGAPSVPPGFGSPQYAAAPAGLAAQPIPYGAPGLPPPMGYGYDPATGMMGNTSGSGGGAVPDEIRYLGWNWGAFLMTPLWSICHSSWMGLLAMLPCVGLVFSVIYGLNGNVYAWQSRRFESLEQFREVQRKWAWAGLIVMGISIVLNVLQMIAAMAAQQGSAPGGVGM